MIEAPKNTRKSSLNSKSTNTTPTANPTFNGDENLYWFSAEKVLGTLALNKNTQNIYYMRGKFTHDFLGNKDVSGKYNYEKQFCLVGEFFSGSLKQLRVRAIPIAITNTTTNALERMFRIDFNTEIDNSSACQKTTIGTFAPASAAYALSPVCPSCFSKFDSSSLTLYENNLTTNQLSKVDSTKFNSSAVAIQIDFSSNSTSDTTVCSNSSCSAKGFDCCIEGQCVKDGSVKSSASSDPGYSQAMSEYAANPLNFIKWPNIFFICSNISHDSTTPTTPADNTNTLLTDAQKRVAAYLQDYKCLNEYKETNTYTQCRTYNSDGVTENGSSRTASAYTSIKYKLAKACGCMASQSEAEMKCPDWGVRPVYKTAVETESNIVDFYCYTPPVESLYGAITNLYVSVPARSAPHRFYSSSGTNYDSLTSVSKTANITQEGQEFYYLDELNKTGAVNGSFNFNSILGSMKVDLSRTAPAKVVTVEVGKTYIVSGTSGYFTPCPQCAKDSWFQTFFSHPKSEKGVGLMARGFSTARDAYGDNLSLGNYEDTKFGRACYLPPTMIPFSHKKDADLQTQRLNRLTTQAAFYINGYQKDWFGFNYGALIGSFDGVKWFAIGSGRRITATSTKLFLAMNGAYLDLATKTDLVANIIPDNGANTAASLDFDPDLDPVLGSGQNKAATCQKYHMCETDSDCVTQLGWEYMCADVSQHQTMWPVFNGEANEVVNQEVKGTIFELFSGSISNSRNKKCVYRGQGAPCKRDYSTFDPNGNQSHKKMLTCAPNFYCAALSTNKFNDEIARSPNEFDDMLFGFDANVLGRPLHYMTGTKSLPTEAITNIKYSATTGLGLNNTEADDLGICRPGRQLSSNAVTAHANPDTSKRTDFISQVGSCNSATTGFARFYTCPAFGSDGNYTNQTAEFANLYQAHMLQNMCGKSAQKSDGTSAFSSIEAGTLITQTDLSTPTLAKDACLRRAGSVCFSDLDCGPNKLHEDLVGSMSNTFFGSTDAEADYWRESLICGQGNPVPLTGTLDYLKYSTTPNRCCRDIGKDFTMFTKGPTALVPENSGSNLNLDTTKFTLANPAANYRYSRYESSPTAMSDYILGTTSKIPQVAAGVTPNADQWRVINETGTNNCCGGGWIRKFADGSHDWKIRNRLSLDATNFSCLNYRSPLAFTTYNSFTADKINVNAYQRDYTRFCEFPFNGGCIQIPFQYTEGFALYGPKLYTPGDNVPVDPYGADDLSGTNVARIDMSPQGDIESGNYTFHMNSDTPYMPVQYIFRTGADQPQGKTEWYFSHKDFDHSVSLYLPAYIGYDGTLATPNNATFIKDIYIKYFYEEASPTVVKITANVSTTGRCQTVVGTPGPNPTDVLIDSLGVDALDPNKEKWCVISDANTGYRPLLHVRANDRAADKWQYAMIMIDYYPLEVVKGYKTATPGNPYYYLSKLSRLELLGIPQIVYEPLYCNDQHDKLVPGIFKSTIATRSDMNTQGMTWTTSTVTAGTGTIGLYEDTNNKPESSGDGNAATLADNYGNVERKVTYLDKVDHSPIFSSKDFTCCTPLGKTPKGGANNCCSGFAVEKDKVLYCKLPPGANINVYFNKFVSSEGVGDSLPGGIEGLSISTDSSVNDFVPHTGEPKFRESTYSKLETLAKTYCSSGKYSQGGLFGNFPGEPTSGTIQVVGNQTDQTFPESIADSILDQDPKDATRGKLIFDQGFRWNNHIYCK